jgi:hypothetical protein
MWIGLFWDHAGSSEMLTLTSLTIWLRWEQAGSGGILSITTLTIKLRWEQAVCGRLRFAGSSGESGFAWSNLVVMEC